MLSHSLNASLPDHIADQFTMNIREAEVTTLVAEGKALVVKAKLVQHGGVEVVNVHRVFGNVEAKVVGAAIADAGLHATTRHPHGESVLVVVAADADFVAAAVLALFDRGTAKLRAPDDEGFIEQTTEFEIAHECGHALIDVFGFGGQAFVESAVVVPVGIVKLNHAHTAFDEAAGEQAVVGEGGLSWHRTIQVERGLGFLGDVHQIGHAGLHAVGHFVLADTGGDLRITQSTEPLFVEGFNSIQDAAAITAGVAFRIAEKEHRITFRTKLDALIDAR